MHDPFGQGAGFIGADHVHAAEVFNRSEPFDDHLLLRHSFGAVGKVDADNRRQQLRGEPNRERQRKEKGVQDRTCQVDVDGKDGDHQHQRHFHKEIAELPYAAFKVRFLRPEFEPLGHLAELGFLACAYDQRLGTAAHHMGSHP